MPEHVIDTPPSGGGWQAGCSCGWMASNRRPTEALAMLDGDDHVAAAVAPAAEIGRHRSEETFKTEDREALEHRFRILGDAILRARALTDHCQAGGCATCALLAEGLALPDTVTTRGHEPREDLEDAVEAVVNRLVAVAEREDEACPGGHFVLGMYRRITAAYENGQGS